MNKKKLPKAVLRTAEQMRDADTSAAPAAKQRPAAPVLPDNVIEMMPKAEAPVASPAGEAAQLRRKAVAIVERYANLSSVGGAIPIPLVNAAAIMALMIRMVKALSELYGVPFERTRTRATVIAVMGGALPTGFSTIAASTFSVIVPGLGLMGLAVASVTSGAFARVIGQLYIEHFENGGAIDLRSIIRR